MVAEILKGKHCESCGHNMLDPSFICPSCGSETLREIEFNGMGTIYTFTIVMVGFGHLAKRAPYCLAIVDIDEGLKLLTIIEDVDVKEVKIGDRVQFKRIEEGTGPIFTNNVQT
ncbi:MAG: OB-fold domain-containing protein [Leptospiraceae bacterium]|nr:OB-fold domain-containing protein [Leptospiraceae bacterium]